MSGFNRTHEDTKLVSELTATAAAGDLDRPHRLAVRADEGSHAATGATATGSAFAAGTTTTWTAATGLTRSWLAGPRARSLAGVLSVRHVAARPVHHVEGERPQIVPSLILVDPDRRFGALAGDAHDAATNEAATLWSRRAAGPLRSRRAARPLWSRGAAPSLRRLRPALLRSLRVADGNHAELAIRRHRVFVLLPEIAPLHQHVDARRKVVSVLGSIEGDRASVLFTAKRQLRFLFASGKMAPGGQRHGHEDGHDGEADEQRRHRITPVVDATASKAATVLTV